MEFRTAYGERNRVVLDCSEDEGRTEQHHKDACDVGQILARYDKTGLITHVSAATARYGDFTQANEYQESLNMVIRAQDAFDQLPAKVRKRFDNDPGAFFEFATDPANLDEMVSLGLAEAIQEPPVTKVEVVNQEPVEGA